MLYNIKTGYNNIKKRDNEDVTILVSSLRLIAQKGMPFLFTDRHAYLQAAEFFDDLESLSRIDWKILKARDFKRDPDDPGKFERYQAEALVHRHVPASALLAVACYTDAVAGRVRALTTVRGLELRVVTKPGWYL